MRSIVIFHKLYSVGGVGMEVFFTSTNDIDGGETYYGRSAQGLASAWTNITWWCFTGFRKLWRALRQRSRKSFVFRYAGTTWSISDIAFYNHLISYASVRIYFIQVLQLPWYLHSSWKHAPSPAVFKRARLVFHLFSGKHQLRSSGNCDPAAVVTLELKRLRSVSNHMA